MNGNRKKKMGHVGIELSCCIDQGQGTSGWSKQLIANKIVCIHVRGYTRFCVVSLSSSLSFVHLLFPVPAPCSPLPSSHFPPLVLSLLSFLLFFFLSYFLFFFSVFVFVLSELTLD